MSVDNYYACVAFVRKQEGGNTNTPGDHGGRTGRGGVTHITYDAYRRGKGLKLRDVFLIGDDEIADIYRKNYWDPIYGDRLPAGEDLAVFDASINSGPAKANKLRAAAGDGDVPTLVHRICAKRLSFLHALGSWRRFGRGWGRRVAACEALGLRMAGAHLPATLEAAKAKQSSGMKQSVIVAVAGVVPAAAGVHSSAQHGLWVTTAAICVVALTSGLTSFNAWRQGARVEALGEAIKQNNTVE